MTDDRSKYFPHAMALLSELHADAVLVVVIGGRLGSGGAPALLLDPQDSSDSRRRNSRIVRNLVTSLEIIAGMLESDVAKSGMPLEVKQ